MRVGRQRGEGTLASAGIADGASNLDDIDVINLLGPAVEVLGQAWQFCQLLRELPDTEDLVAQRGMNLLDDVVQAYRIGQQFVVFFGVGENGQHADLVNQAGEGALIRLEVGET